MYITYNSGQKKMYIAYNNMLLVISQYSDKGSRDSRVKAHGHVNIREV